MLPTNYKPGDPMSYPMITRFEMLDESGKLWATVRGRAIEIHAPEGGFVATIAPGLAYTTGRKPQPKRTEDSRLVASVSGWVRDRGEDRLEWELPGRAGRVEVSDLSGAICATLICDGERVSILDAAGNVRIVMSLAEQPPAHVERFRTTMDVSGEVVLHFLLIDGSAPVGKTADYLMP